MGGNIHPNLLSRKVSQMTCHPSIHLNFVKNYKSLNKLHIIKNKIKN